MDELYRLSNGYFAGSGQSLHKQGRKLFRELAAVIRVDQAQHWVTPDVQLVAERSLALSHCATARKCETAVPAEVVDGSRMPFELFGAIQQHD